MPTLTQSQMNMLAADVAAADADPNNGNDRVAYYTQLATDGDNYGGLAAGVVFGSTLSGYVAGYFLRSQALAQYGVTLSADQFNQISLQLMDADWEVRENDSGIASVYQIQAYHEQVFDGSGLGRQVWTATVPLDILGYGIWPELIDGINGSTLRGQVDVYRRIDIDYQEARLGIGNFTSDQESQMETWLHTTFDAGSLYVGQAIVVNLGNGATDIEGDVSADNSGDIITSGFDHLQQSIRSEFGTSSYTSSSQSVDSDGDTDSTEIVTAGDDSIEVDISMSQSGAGNIDYSLKTKNLQLSLTQDLSSATSLPVTTYTTKQDETVVVGSPGTDVFTLSETGSVGSRNVLVGNTGTNTFNIDVKFSPTNSGATIIWGGGGTSTYNFTALGTSQGSSNGGPSQAIALPYNDKNYTVVILHIDNPTIENLTSLDAQSILKQYAQQIADITFSDPSNYQNLVVIVNPSQNDVINYDGQSISDFQTQYPTGYLGFGGQVHVDYQNLSTVTVNQKVYSQYQDTDFVGAPDGHGLIPFLSISNITPGDFGTPGGGSSGSGDNPLIPSALFGAGDDTITADSGFGAGSGDILTGQGGDVTYSVGAGDGTVTVENNVGTDTNDTVLAFDASIASSDVTVTGSSLGFVLADATASTSVLIANASQDPTANVSAVTFSDGTVWSEAALIAMADTPSTTNTSLYGDAGTNVLDSQGIATYEQGNGGGDTFTYKTGYGALEINESEPNGATNVLAFGPGITAAQLQVAGDANGDLILTDGTAGDQVQLDGMLTNPEAGVQSVIFADGTSLTAPQLIAQELLPNMTHTSLYGTSGDDVLDSQGIATFEQGNGGNDTFVYHEGYGALTIDETETGTATSIISFGPGITASSLTASGGPNGALLLGDGTPGDTITLAGMLTNSQMGVQQVTFSDGTSLTAAQLVSAEMQARPGNTTIYGTSGADILDSQGIARSITGEGGGDTFLYNSGYGSLEINEQEPGNATNILSLGSGITASQLQVGGDANSDLILTDGVAGDRIQLDGMLSGAPVSGVQEVTFSDGTSLTAAQLIAAEMQAGPDNTSLYGTPGADLLDSKGIATFESGDGGGDIFIYDRGYGSLEISEVDASAAPDNTLQFGTGITAAQLTVTRDSGGNIYLSDGIVGDRIQLDNEMNGAPYGVETVEFADGSTLSEAQLIQQASQTAPIVYGTTGADVLQGTPNAEIIDGKGAPSGTQDYAIGGGGGDTFIYNAGYGQLQIDELDFGSSPDNTLLLGAGITAAGVIISGDSSGDVFLTDGITGDSVELDDELDGSFYGVQTVQFADGSTLSKAELTQLATTIDGTPGADILSNTPYGSTIDGKGAPAGSQDYEQGQGGGDVFVYDQGYGHLEIHEADGGPTPDNTLRFGPGITLANLNATSDGSGDILLSDGTPGDQIEIDGEFSGSTYGGLKGIQTVQFADGSTLSQAQLVALSDTVTGSGKADTLYADTVAETFDGKGAPAGSADYEQGMGGGDTFVYNQGYGELEIYESESGNNILELGTGISLASLTISSDSSGNVFLEDGIADDLIQLDSQLSSASTGIEAIQFADGSTLNQAQLAEIAENAPNSPGSIVISGTTGAETLSATAHAETFDGKGAPAGSQDYARGGGGGDTFVYNAGYGQLEIYEVDYGPSPNNVLQFGPGITAAQLTVAEDSSGSIYLTDGTQGDRIKIDYESSFAYGGVQTVKFADGSTLSDAQLIQLAETGTPAADSLYGTSGVDIFDGKGAPLGTQDYEQGYGGGDTFVYNAGYGQLEINERDYTGATNVLALGTGITASQVQISDDGNGNLVLTDGVAGDRIQLDNMLSKIPFAGTPFAGVQLITFADGTSWTAQQAIATLPITVSGDAQDVEQSNGHITFADNEGPMLYTATLEGSTDAVALQNGYGLTATGDANTVSVSGSSNVTAVGQDNTVSASSAPGSAAYTFAATGDSNTLIAGAGTGNLSADGDQNTLQGGSGTDDLSLSGNDNLFLGGDGSDSVIVAGDENVLVGGAGQMTFIAQSGGGNIYEAGPGHVTVDYSQDTEAVRVDLTAGTASFAQSSGVDQLDYIPEVHIGSDSSILAGPMPVSLVINGNDSTLVGGSSYDSLTAVGSGNTLQAGLGGANLTATGDANLLVGGSVYSNLIAMGSDNTLQAGAGGANLTATGDANLLDGGTTFYAVLAASGNQNTLQGGSGTNTLIVSGDSNLLTSGGGYEEVDVTGSDNSLDAYDSNVSVSLSGDGNVFTGGSNYASVVVEGNGNFVTGGSQYTSITARSGSGNTYDAGAGYATLDYSQDREPVSVNLATGTASFVGSSGVDTIEGITQATIGSNSSILAGSSGTNLLINGAGSTLQGGDGFDVLTSNGDGDTLIAGSGGGSLTASGSSNFLEGGSAYTVLTGYGNQNTFQGGEGTNTFVSYGENNVLTGGGGYEDITLYGDDNTLHTEASNTALTVNGDGNDITGGSDYTSVNVSGSDNAFIGGSAAIDFKSFGGSGNSFDGGTGRASLDYSGNPFAASVDLAACTASFAGSSSVDTISNISTVMVGSNGSIIGDGGSDSLYIFGDGGTLQGGSGSDALTAYGQNDTLTAGSGGGVLNANGTNDVYSGDPAKASVTIQNNPGTGEAANQLSFLSDASTEQLWLTQSGNDLQIQTVGSRYTTTVQGWFSDPASQLQEINSSDGWHLDTGVSQLVQAMATYDSSHPGFDPATASIMPTDSALQGAIAAAWHH